MTAHTITTGAAIRKPSLPTRPATCPGAVLGVQDRVPVVPLDYEKGLVRPGGPAAG